MLKKLVLGVLLVSVVAVLAFGVFQATSAKYGTEVDILRNGRGGERPAWPSGQEVVDGTPGMTAGANVDRPASPVDFSEVNPGDLSQAEIDGLLFMREEEQLARDVYLAMYEKWDLQIFQNIAGSEQTHMDSVVSLLEGYGAADLTVPAQEGQFVNADLQTLYHQLVEQGSQSLADALKVGAAIEEIDIRDLQERSAQTDETAIQAVYQNLELGSENHLRAFTSTLTRQSGETYQPQYLGVENYQTIVSSSNGNGGNRGGWKGGRP